MRLVADSNVLLAIALEDPEKAGIVRATRGAEVVGPEILPYEIGNALTALYKRRRLRRQQAIDAYRITRQIPVRLVAVDVGKALEIALQFNIYAYDAYFLHCARALACPLLTLDRRMREVATKLGIETLAGSP
jgi:predicted nucleic acid-binding protein